MRKRCNSGTLRSAWKNWLWRLQYALSDIGRKPESHELTCTTCNRWYDWPSPWPNTSEDASMCRPTRTIHTRGKRRSSMHPVRPDPIYVFLACRNLRVKSHRNREAVRVCSARLRRNAHRHQDSKHMGRDESVPHTRRDRLAHAGHHALQHDPGYAGSRSGMHLYSALCE